jgi:hypothetical protein
MAAEAQQIERTRRKAWLRARSEVFVPYKQFAYLYYVAIQRPFD